ncbi:monoglyceride lipase isoform X1 [Erpetoichthys calabaricus]|uniref:Monoglyceride lipase n=2 Tax=Erpetoichthys calabaricus TaxID=27687 RepID=A0A8C4T427_ERPCA|nr:monoglyceride lipase isoform X1 [Erpetoichthys calabaricus]
MFRLSEHSSGVAHTSGSEPSRAGKLRPSESQRGVGRVAVNAICECTANLTVFTEMPEETAQRLSPQGVPYKDLPHIVNEDGQYLFCKSWEPKGQPRALVFVAHGAGEHCGRYSNLAEMLTEHSMLVFTHDHVGHGQSEGERMVISDFHIFVRDVLQHIDIMKKSHPGLPVYILGHSMGGAISILAACDKPNDFAGVILIAPMVIMNPESATPFKVFLAKLLNHLLPSLTLGQIDSKWVSRDQKEVEDYEADELNYRGGLRISFGMQLMSATTKIEKALPDISWPYLLLHGTGDKLCDIKGSQLFFEKSQSVDKTLKVYEGAYHALHKEVQEVANAVFKEISSWIIQRLPQGEEVQS